MGGSVAVIFLIVLLVRYLNSRRRSGRASFSIPAWVGVCAAKLFLTLVMIGATAATGRAGALLFGLAMVVMWAPTIVAGWIAVPLRLPRVAYWIIRVCRPLTLDREPIAAGVMYGALALARTGTSDATSEWLRRRLAAARPLRGAGVVATGLLAARRGDGNRARCLFRIADSSPTTPRAMTPRAARVIARDWLVADAARSGDWREVVRLGRRGRESLRWSYTMARIAERLIGDPRACNDWLLWPCFLLAPRRHATFPLLRRALAMPVRIVPQSEAGASDAADLPQALADLARAIGNPYVHDASSLARCIGAVDRHIENMRSGIERRLNALGGRGGADAVISAFGRRLVDLVTPVIEADPRLALAAERSASFERAIAQVRRRLFRDVEVQCRDYKEQKETLLDAPFEWERWAVLRNTADRVLALDPAAEGALFLTMYTPVCNFAVTQHNTHSRYALAHDMFCWLLRHCGSDTQAQQLLAKNAKAGAG
jgi:hypothetical protein